MFIGFYKHHVVGNKDKKPHSLPHQSHIAPAVQGHADRNSFFNRTTGLPTSAYDLTWSFASFVTMARRRMGQFPPSWGFNSAAPAASTCMPTFYNSVSAYTPVTSAGAPTVSKSCARKVLFTVNASTIEGQNIYLLGNTSLLGGFVNNPDELILPCNLGNYTSLRAEWYIDIWLPAG